MMHEIQSAHLLVILSKRNRAKFIDDVQLCYTELC